MTVLLPCMVSLLIVSLIACIGKPWDAGKQQLAGTNEMCLRMSGQMLPCPPIGQKSSGTMDSVFPVINSRQPRVQGRVIEFSPLEASFSPGVGQGIYVNEIAMIDVQYEKLNC